MSVDPDRQRIEQDIHAIVGGNFTPDSLGPEIVNETLDRVRTRAPEYIKEFESLFLGPNFDAARQSRLHLPTFLKLIVDSEPDLVRSIAERLAKQYDAVLVIYDSVEETTELQNVLPEDAWNLSHRLARRRNALKELID